MGAVAADDISVEVMGPRAAACHACRVQIPAGSEAVCVACNGLSSRLYAHVSCLLKMWSKDVRTLDDLRACPAMARFTELSAEKRRALVSVTDSLVGAVTLQMLQDKPWTVAAALELANRGGKENLDRLSERCSFLETRLQEAEAARAEAASWRAAAESAREEALRATSRVDDSRKAADKLYEKLARESLENERQRSEISDIRSELDAASKAEEAAHARRVGDLEAALQSERVARDRATEDLTRLRAASAEEHAELSHKLSAARKATARAEAALERTRARAEGETARANSAEEELLLGSARAEAASKRAKDAEAATESVLVQLNTLRDRIRTSIDQAKTTASERARTESYREFAPEMAGALSSPRQFVLTDKATEPQEVQERLKAADALARVFCKLEERLRGASQPTAHGVIEILDAKTSKVYDKTQLDGFFVHLSLIARPIEAFTAENAVVAARMIMKTLNCSADSVTVHAKAEKAHEIPAESRAEQFRWKDGELYYRVPATNTMRVAPAVNLGIPVCNVR